MKESRTIKDVCWMKNTLYVIFKMGNKVYEYENVPESVFDDFMNADSLGKFFAANIKDKYETHSFDKSAHISPPWPWPKNPAPGELLGWTPEEEEAFLLLRDDGMNGEIK